MLVENEVDIVFCQKVIHPSIKSYLIEKNCIPIERLSITYVESVTELTSECAHQSLYPLIFIPLRL